MLAREYREYYTIDDYKYWDGDWELIYGSPYAMAPSPLVTHQSVSGKIFLELSRNLDMCPNCQALFEIDWEVSLDTIVKPDLVVICYEPDEKLTKRPNLIFEVTSHSTVRRDETIKFELYQSEGVEYYVIVYPHKRIAKLYRLKDGRYIKVNDFENEKYKFDLDECSIDFDFSKIWRVKGKK